MQTGVKKKIYTGHTGWVSSMCTDGGVLFSASHDSTARAWEISVSSSYSSSLSLSLLLLSTYFLFFLQTGRELVIYSGHEGWVRSVAVQGQVVFTASNDHTVRCWNMRVRFFSSLLSSSLLFSSLLFSSLCLIFSFLFFYSLLLGMLLIVYVGWNNSKDTPGTHGQCELCMRA